MRLYYTMIAAALAAFSFQSPSRADVIAYATATDGNLYLVDLSNATETLIGPMGEANIPEGIALSPSGALFSTDASGNLYSVNKTTGAATLVGDTGLGDIEGLAFDGSTLLGTNFNSPTTIYSINTSNASTTSVVSAAVALVRAMELENSNNVFVTNGSCSIPPCSTNTELSSINLTTGVDTDIGALIDDSELTAALAYNGILYGLDSAGNEYIIDPSNAGLTFVGNAGGLFYVDATIAVVPEPTTLALTGAGLIFLWWVGLTQRRRHFGQQQPETA